MGLNVGQILRHPSSTEKEPTSAHRERSETSDTIGASQLHHLHIAEDE
jgi:hypothetical protein